MLDLAEFCSAYFRPRRLFVSADVGPRRAFVQLMLDLTKLVSTHFGHKSSVVPLGVQIVRINTKSARPYKGSGYRGTDI